MHNEGYTNYAQPEYCASALCQVFAAPKLNVGSLLGWLDICLQQLTKFKDLHIGKEGASHTDAWAWTICIRFIFGYAYGCRPALRELSKALRSNALKDESLGVLLLRQLRLTLGDQPPRAFVATELLDTLRSPYIPMPTDMLLATSMYNVDTGSCCGPSLQALFAILQGVSPRGLRSWIATYHAYGLTQQTDTLIGLAVGWLETPFTAALESCGYDDSDADGSLRGEVGATSSRVTQVDAVPEALKTEIRCAMKLLAAFVWSCPALAQQALGILLERLGDEGPGGTCIDSPLWDVLGRIVQDIAAMLAAAEYMEAAMCAPSNERCTDPDAHIAMLAGDEDTFGELLCQCEELLAMLGAHATRMLDMPASAAVRFTQLLAPLLPFSDQLVLKLHQAAVNRLSAVVGTAAAEDEAAEATGREVISAATAPLNGAPATSGCGLGDAGSPAQSTGMCRSDSRMSGASQMSAGVSSTSWALMDRWRQSSGFLEGAVDGDTADSRSGLQAAGPDTRVLLGDADVALEVLACTLTHCRRLPHSMEGEVLALVDGLLVLACRRVTAASRVRTAAGQRQSRGGQGGAAVVSHRIISRVQATLSAMPTVRVSGAGAPGGCCGDDDEAEGDPRLPLAHGGAVGGTRWLHLPSLLAGRMALILESFLEEDAVRDAVPYPGTSMGTGLCSQGIASGIDGDEAVPASMSLANCLRWRLSDAGRRGLAFITAWRAVQRRGANNARQKIELSAPPLSDMIRLLGQAIDAVDSGATAGEQAQVPVDDREEQLFVLAEMLVHAVYGSCSSTGQPRSACPVRIAHSGAQSPPSDDCVRAEAVALLHIRMQILVALIEVLILHPRTVGLGLLRQAEPLLPATRAAASTLGGAVTAGTAAARHTTSTTVPWDRTSRDTAAGTRSTLSLWSMQNPDGPSQAAIPPAYSDLGGCSSAAGTAPPTAAGSESHPVAAVQDALRTSIQQAVQASNNGLLVAETRSLPGPSSARSAQLKAGHDGVGCVVAALAACHLNLQNELARLRPPAAVASSLKTCESAVAPTPHKSQLPTELRAVPAMVTSVPDCPAKEQGEKPAPAPVASVRSGVRSEGSRMGRSVGFMMKKPVATPNAAVSARGPATSALSQGTTMLTPPSTAPVQSPALNVCPQDAWPVSRHDAWPLSLEASEVVLRQLLGPLTDSAPAMAEQIERWRVLAHCTSLVLKSLRFVWHREERPWRAAAQCSEGSPGGAASAPAERLLAAGLIAVKLVTSAREAQEAALRMSSTCDIGLGSRRDACQLPSDCAPAARPGCTSSSVQLTDDMVSRGSAPAAAAGAEASDVAPQEPVSIHPESVPKQPKPTRVKNMLKSLASNMHTITHSLMTAGQGGRTRRGAVATPTASRLVPQPRSSQSGAPTLTNGTVTPKASSQMTKKLDSSVPVSTTAATDSTADNNEKSSEMVPVAGKAAVISLASQARVASSTGVQLAVAAGQASTAALRLLVEVVRTTVAHLPPQAAISTSPLVTAPHESRHPSRGALPSSRASSTLAAAASVLGQHGASPPSALPSSVPNTTHAACGEGPTAATAPSPAAGSAQSLLSSLVQALYPYGTRHAAVRFGLFVQRPDFTTFMGFLSMVDECPHAGGALCVLLEASWALMGRGMPSSAATSTELQEAQKEHVAALIELATAFSTADFGDRAGQLVDLACNIGMRMLLAAGPATMHGSCKHWTAILSSAARAAEVVGGIGCTASGGTAGGRVFTGSEAEHLAGLACRGLAPAHVSDIAAQLIVAITDAARNQGGALAAALPAHRPLTVQPVCAMMLRKALLSRMPQRVPGSNMQVPGTATSPAWLASIGATGLARVLLTLGAAVRPALKSIQQAVAKAMAAEAARGEGSDDGDAAEHEAVNLGLEDLPVAVATTLACASLATDRLLASIPSGTEPPAVGAADVSSGGRDCADASRDPVLDTVLLLWALPQLMAAVQCVKASSELLLYRAMHESVPGTAPPPSPSHSGPAARSQVGAADQPDDSLSLCQVVALGRFYLPQLDGLLAQVQSGPSHRGPSQRLRWACRMLRSAVEECEVVWSRLQEVLDAAEPLAADLAPQSRRARRQPMRLVPSPDMPPVVALLHHMRRATAWACGQQQEQPSGMTLQQSEQKDSQASGAPEGNAHDDDSIPDEPLFLLWGCVDESDDDHEECENTDDDPNKHDSGDADDEAFDAAGGDNVLQLSTGRPLHQRAPSAFRALRRLRSNAAPEPSTRFQDVLSGKTVSDLGAARDAQPAKAAARASGLHTKDPEPRSATAAGIAPTADGSGPVRRSRRIAPQPVQQDTDAAAGVGGGGLTVSRGPPTSGTTAGPGPSVSGVSHSRRISIEGGCNAVCHPLQPAAARRLAAATAVAGRPASVEPNSEAGTGRTTSIAHRDAVAGGSGRSGLRSQACSGPARGRAAAVKQSESADVAKRKRARDIEEDPEPKRTGKRAKQQKDSRNAYVAACLRETAGRESGSDREWSDLEDFIVCQPGRNYKELLGRKYQYDPIDDED